MKKTNFFKFIVFLMLLFSHQSIRAQELIRIGIYLEPLMLDPTITASASTSEITYNNIFEGLTKIDRDGDVQPLLARSWQISQDGLEYIFTLQDGVKFHDGSFLTSDTVVFSLDRINNSAVPNPHKELYSIIKEVRAIDKNKVQVILSEPDSSFLFNLGLSAAVIVHPGSVANNKVHPIGTGPYAFKFWKVEDRVAVNFFPDYWGKEPAIKKAEFIFTPSSVEVDSALADGSIDGYRDTSGQRFLKKFSSRSDYTIVKSHGEGEIILAINNARSPFNDIRVRKALAYAIDKQALAEDPDFNNGESIGSHFSPRHPAYVDLTDRYPYDPDKARALLADAGLKDGFELTISVPSISYTQIGAFHIASQFEDIGLRVNPERVDWSEWMSQVFIQKDYDVTIISHVSPNDIHIYAKDDYYFNYDNEKFKALWAKIKRTMDKKERYKLLADAQKMLSDDCVNVFLFMKAEYGIWKSNIGGIWESTFLPAVVLSDLYWIE